MDDELDGIRAALAAIPDALLAGVQSAADESPHLAPGLLAFIAHACDWERARRIGHHFRLNGPHAAIPQAEMGASLAVLSVLLAAFGAESTVGNLLAATGDALDSERPTVH